MKNIRNQLCRWTAGVLMAVMASTSQAQGALDFLQKLKEKADQVTNQVNNIPLSPSQGSNPGIPQTSTSATSAFPAPYTGYKGDIPPPPRRTVWNKETNTILFSKKPIKVGKEDKAAITNQFEAGDQISAMAYLKDNLKSSRLVNQFKVYIYDAEDANRYYSANFTRERNNDLLEKRDDGSDPGVDRHFEFDIFADAKTALQPQLTFTLMEAMNRFLTNRDRDEKDWYRTHVLEVELQMNYEPVASGILYYKITPENVGKFKAMYQTHVNAGLKDERLPDASHKDPALEAKIKAVMTARGNDVRKVALSRGDWEIVRNKLTGIVTHRLITAYVVSKEKKSSNPDECYYNELRFREDYVGSGFTGKLQLDGAGLMQTKILCSNVK
ncbi:hypothetical protein SAMN06265795_11575 [Noviherbaspirillum humi]|uniref:Uncharacterized protein n=1 Tax=Noviherbaspirillum humi TaxID=1688639 RepID=A0A239KAB8_9BURK|nr:hypothetical protein [Noviherbaspirillum humi]SNT15337.1 hypothetical protein SAMN06265795_11575 [Noviherbaspirillum humi]